MKLKNQISALLILVALTFALPVDSLAQHHHRHVRHGWYTAHHCRVETRHVYFPMHNIYYDVHRDMYIYLSGNNWVFSVNLPVQFARVDLRYEPIVELDFYLDNPYIYNSYHIVTYKDYHRHYGKRNYREYGHNHSYYKHHHNNHGNGHNNKSYNHENRRDHRNYGNHRDNRYEHRDHQKSRNDYGRNNERNYGNKGNNVKKDYKTNSSKQYQNNKETKKYGPRDSDNNSGNGRKSNGRSSSGIHRM